VLEERVFGNGAIIHFESDGIDDWVADLVDRSFQIEQTPIDLRHLRCLPASFKLVIVWRQVRPVVPAAFLLGSRTLSYPIAMQSRGLNHRARGNGPNRAP
jgi:hypothetical protein